MTTPFTPIDIVNFAANKDAVGIQTAFDQLVSAKVQDAIQQRKVEIAKSFLADPEEASQDQEEDEEQQTDGVMSGETEEQESEESHENAEQHA